MTMLMQDVPRQRRVNRYPQHSFVLKQKPYEIQPFMIAPVLPGETLENGLLQARIVSDPIKHPLIGWWAEHYFFYVKHSQLSDDFKEMHLDLEHSLAAHVPAAAAPHLYAIDDNGGIDWMQKCYDLIVQEYFRDEGDAPSNHVIRAGRYSAGIQRESWLNSVADTTVLDPGETLGDIDTTAAEDITMERLLKAQRTYQFMLANQLTNMSYEDFLRTHGVRPTLAEDPERPELLRNTSNWTYPTNTIDATDGSAASAVSWAITERISKDRFFKEPGFVIGLQVIRPKVYLAKQKASLAQWLDNALAWMPAIMRDDAATSLREFANNQGPLAGNVTNGYWVDLRDLFLYGDQFANYDLDAATDGTNAIDLPTAGLNTRYPTEAMVDALFAADTAEEIRTDGVVSLQIKSVLVDATPTSLTGFG